MPESRESEISACRVTNEIRLDAANSTKECESADPGRCDADWRGRDSDPALETEVRVLWSPSTLYLRFACRYRELFVFGDSDPNGRRDHLWDRDVAEAFLQPGWADPEADGVVPAIDHVGPDALVRGGAGEGVRPYMFYKEFEIAPNGMWIDLDISPSGLADLKSGLTRSVQVDELRRNCVAEMAIPMKAITTKFDPGAVWRANFYRVEGRLEPRQYMPLRPTHTPQPNFHVPQAFRTLRFEG